MKKGVYSIFYFVGVFCNRIKRFIYVKRYDD